MVKVREEQPLFIDGTIDLELWLSKLAESNPGINLARFRKVCELSEQAEGKAIQSNTLWSEGQSSYRMGLEMADILNGLRVDEDGLIAAIIYRAVRENQITLNHVRNQFGDEVESLVQGVLKMAAISNIQFGSRKPVLGEKTDQLEQARRMLLAMVDDIRVVLIKLAERTCAIRAVSKSSAEKRIRLAREVFEIYAPLAHRLGIGHLKWELEDLSLRYIEPLSYKRIAKHLDEKRTARQVYIDEVIIELDEKLRLANIEASLEGRAKHIYSIWRKMRRKGISFSEVYDVRAVRLLVKEVEDCYRALGVVHNIWRNIPHEFDDYIANPKENGYKSLHTAVVGPHGKVLEVQIRTEDMHEKAEYGVYSHWQYKDVKNESKSYEERIEWLRQIMDWQEELEDVPGLAREILTDVNLDRIYMFTPDGDVVDMTPGATPVDFAYRVHTEVGHKCRGAKLNGRVVPLNTTLKSGDRVEIIVGDEAEPRREWLHEHLGYVTTARAKAKIQTWFSHREKQKNIDAGKKILLDELSHLGIEQLDFSELVERMQFDSSNDLFYAIALGKVDVVDAAEIAAEITGLEERDSQLNLGLDGQGSEPRELLVSGLGDLDYVISDCCKPVPGDSIIGVIDDDNTVHVHLQDCLQALKADVYGRIMRLDWVAEVTSTFPVSIQVQAYDRAGLLYDITGIFMQQTTNVLSIQMATDKQNNQVTLKMKIEVAKLTKLLHMLEMIEQLPNVITARRSIS
ncbi:MAG: bifunctional (p)ppGpp synthetase/guanosine-3',5'-bis(diphosphate) 3'-pyrophosphohydrolase [Proteobacteria bacterium]|nr:bifunctional (p)ppGpp synthetase/guanosine-3',5'-bis(diphosphate) 3'-pyrophosphohydrolase [Pseudomonadota bacterium]